MLAKTSPTPFQRDVKSAKGSWITDTRGKHYLDFISGIGVSNLGHARQEIIDAITEQIKNHAHTMVYGEFKQKSVDEFATELCSLLPKHLNCVYPVNSGTEANEAAIKIARRHTHRPNLVAFKGAYHGNTIGSMSISWNEHKKSVFRPLMPGTRFIELNNENQLKIIDQNTAAVILETIQGDAGVRLPNSNYLKKLKQRCEQTGTLLIFDEIQCGYGRSGTFCAFEQFGVTPHILTLGKALGAGLPIGAVVSSAEVFTCLQSHPKLGHITTFGGNPVVCAAALAGLKIWKIEHNSYQIKEKGEYLKQQLESHPKVKAVRQIGLMLGVDLENESLTNQVIELCKTEGLLLFWFLSHPYAFRIAPPLNISFQDLKWGCKTLLKILDRV